MYLTYVINIKSYVSDKNKNLKTLYYKTKRNAEEGSCFPTTCILENGANLLSLKRLIKEHRELLGKK